LTKRAYLSYEPDELLQDYVYEASTVSIGMGIIIIIIVVCNRPITARRHADAFFFLSATKDTHTHALNRR